jgi:hypothetical protein
MCDARRPFSVFRRAAAHSKCGERIRHTGPPRDETMYPVLERPEDRETFGMLRPISALLANRSESGRSRRSRARGCFEGYSERGVRALAMRYSRTFGRISSADRNPSTTSTGSAHGTYARWSTSSHVGFGSGGVGGVRGSTL